jgi:thiamine-monophosphate kinase
VRAAGNGSTLGAGADDVAVVRSNGKNLVVKVDMLVERTDVPPGMTYRQAARKAVASCVSDFAAKGVRPRAFLVSLGLRRGTSQAQVEELGRGFRDAESEWKVKMVGGDTNEAGELVIDCAMVGFADRFVRRSGGRPGEALVVTGRFGYQPAGLKILMEGAKGDRAFSARAKDSVLNPGPDLRVGLALAGYLSSGMDSSDGLARSLHTLAGEGKLGFEVTALPLGEGVKKFAQANGASPEELVLEGGEEYVIVGTMPRDKLRAAKKAVRRVGGEVIVIGRATAEAGRVELRSGGRTRPIEDRGWTHLA